MESSEGQIQLPEGREVKGPTESKGVQDQQKTSGGTLSGVV